MVTEQNIGITTYISTGKKNNIANKSKKMKGNMRMPFSLTFIRDSIAFV